MYKFYIYKYFTYQKLTEVVFYVFPVSALLIEFMILSIVNREDSYGYEISQTIKLVADIKESTLYPILKKLEKGGLRDDVFRRVPGQKTEVLFDHRSRKNTDGVSAGRMEVLP